MKPTKSAVKNADAVINELNRKAINAARTNKPEMWDYYRDMKERLINAFGFVPRSNERYESIAFTLATPAEFDLLNSAPHVAVRRYAVSVYARRILRGTRQPAPRASLDWFRKRTGIVK